MAAYIARRLVWVVFLLFIYALVIISTLKLRGQDDGPDTYRAPTPALLVGLVGNVVLLGYVVVDDPAALLWCAALLALGFALFLVEYYFGSKKDPSGTGRGGAMSKDEV